MNVLDIACLGSQISDFDSHAWRTAKDYDFLTIKEIQEGYKNWESLSRSIDPTIWQIARDLNPKQYQSQTNPKSNKNPNQNSSQNSSQKLCTTWNTLRQEGCHYAFNNPGETCVYSHQCSSCRQRGFPNRKHKSIHCRDSNPNNQTNATLTSATVTPAPPVTSV